MANHVDEGYYRITLDIGNYREKRKETLEALGKKIALKAVKIGRNYPLEPMNPYERRIIHTAVQEVEGAKSWSEGEDIARHVVIGPVDGERPQRRGGYNNRGPRRSGGRSGYNNNRDRGGYRRDRNDRPRPTRTENEAPARPKVDSGSTALYGRIEVKK